MSCWSAVPTGPAASHHTAAHQRITADPVPLAPAGPLPVPTRPAANSAGTPGAVRAPAAAPEARLSGPLTAPSPIPLAGEATPTNRAAREGRLPGGVAA